MQANDGLTAVQIFSQVHQPNSEPAGEGGFDRLFVDGGTDEIHPGGGLIIPCLVFIQVCRGDYVLFDEVLIPFQILQGQGGLAFQTEEDAAGNADRTPREGIGVDVGCIDGDEAVGHVGPVGDGDDLSADAVDVSDEGAVLAGSIGMLASASVGGKRPSGAYVGLYEPVHGSAPDIAGKGVANPLAAILTMGMMVAHIGLVDEAARIERAVKDCLDARECTVDVGGTLGTAATGDAVVRRLKG